jgi:hypothetical protein
MRNENNNQESENDQQRDPNESSGQENQNETQRQPNRRRFGNRYANRARQNTGDGVGDENQQDQQNTSDQDQPQNRGPRQRPRIPRYNNSNNNNNNNEEQESAQYQMNRNFRPRNFNNRMYRNPGTYTNEAQRPVREENYNYSQDNYFRYNRGYNQKFPNYRPRGNYGNFRQQQSFGKFDTNQLNLEL